LLQTVTNTSAGQVAAVGCRGWAWNTVTQLKSRDGDFKVLVGGPCHDERARNQLVEHIYFA
jgi:hypothetical protein